jgi:hypothetical protein
VGPANMSSSRAAAQTGLRAFQWQWAASCSTTTRAAGCRARQRLELNGEAADVVLGDSVTGGS